MIPCIPGLIDSEFTGLDSSDRVDNSRGGPQKKQKKSKAVPPSDPPQMSPSHLSLLPLPTYETESPCRSVFPSLSRSTAHQSSTTSNFEPGKSTSKQKVCHRSSKNL